METSQEMMQAMLRYIPKDANRILDPSCGTGELIRFIQEYHPNARIDGVELNGERWIYLMNNSIHKKSRFFHGDFLSSKIYNEMRRYHYDCIVAVPPYRDNIDCQHIMRMYDILDTGGILISYTLPTWTTGMYENQVQFRSWLRGKTIQAIEFIEDKSYVSCPKMLLVLQK